MSEIDVYSTCNAALKSMRGTKETLSVWAFPDLERVLVEHLAEENLATCDGFEGKVGWVKYRSTVQLSECVKRQPNYSFFGTPLFAEWVDGDCYFRVFPDPKSLGNLKQVQITEGKSGKPYLRQIVQVAGDGKAKGKILRYHVYFSIDQNGCTQRAFDAFAGFDDGVTNEGAN